MSPRAAWRLEQLGFSDVYDYVAGKAAWMGCGLPIEGGRGADDLVGSLAERSVPTCEVSEHLADVEPRFGGAEIAVVLNDDDVVMGLLRPEVFGLDPATEAGDVMQPGPSTFRPSMTIEEARDYVAQGKAPRLLITTLDGNYVGVVPVEKLAG